MNKKELTRFQAICEYNDWVLILMGDEVVLSHQELKGEQMINFTLRKEHLVEDMERLLADLIMKHTFAEKGYEKDNYDFIAGCLEELLDDYVNATTTILSPDESGIKINEILDTDTYPFCEVRIFSLFPFYSVIIDDLKTKQINKMNQVMTFGHDGTMLFTTLDQPCKYQKVNGQQIFSMKDLHGEKAGHIKWIFKKEVED